MTREIRLDDGITKDYATIGRWLVAPGDRVEAGQALVELEADKVTHELVAEERGVIVELAAAEGDELSLGDLLLTLRSDVSD